jgi:hypothetical protein
MLLYLQILFSLLLLILVLVLLSNTNTNINNNWLRRYVTNLKVAGSRPDEVNDFYQVT